MICPNCGAEEVSGALECSKCLVIFSKLKAKQEKQSAVSAAPAGTPEEPSSPFDYFAAVKYAVTAGAIAILFFGGQTFMGWFGGWFKTARNNSPAGRQAAMPNMNIPKVDFSKMSPGAALTNEINAAQRVQAQAAINGAIAGARSNAAASAAVSAAVRQPQVQPAVPAGSRH